jgi:hypothetical protein
MKTIVRIDLAVSDKIEEVDRSAPLLVSDLNSEYAALHKDEPFALAQMQSYEDVAYFEAEYDDEGEIVVGKRVPPPLSELH